jgi:hypothetical protein
MNSNLKLIFTDSVLSKYQGTEERGALEAQFSNIFIARSRFVEN